MKPVLRIVALLGLVGAAPPLAVEVTPRVTIRATVRWEGLSGMRTLLSESASCFLGETAALHKAVRVPSPSAPGGQRIEFQVWFVPALLEETELWLDVRTAVTRRPAGGDVSEEPSVERTAKFHSLSREDRRTLVLYEGPGRQQRLLVTYSFHAQPDIRDRAGSVSPPLSIAFRAFYREGQRREFLEEATLITVLREPVEYAFRHRLPAVPPEPEPEAEPGAPESPPAAAPMLDERLRLSVRPLIYREESCIADLRIRGTVYQEGEIRPLDYSEIVELPFDAPYTINLPALLGTPEAAGYVFILQPRRFSWSR